MGTGTRGIQGLDLTFLSEKYLKKLGDGKLLTLYSKSHHLALLCQELARKYLLAEWFCSCNLCSEVTKVGLRVYFDSGFGF